MIGEKKKGKMWGKVPKESFYEEMEDGMGMGMVQGTCQLL